MTIGMHHIDGDFLPPLSSRFKRAAQTILFGYASNPYKEYSDPDVQKFSTTTPEGVSYNFSIYDASQRQGIPQSEQQALVILGGLRSMAHDKQHLFEHAKARGIPIVFGELPQPDDVDDMQDLMPAIDSMAKHFLTNLPGVERYQSRRLNFFGCSTGGYQAVNFLHDGGDAASEFLRTFQCVKLFSAFFEASYNNGAITKHAYPPHATLHASHHYGQNAFDKIHMVIKELTGDPVYIDPQNNTYPEHGEILYMADAIKSRSAKILSTPFPEIVKRMARNGKIEFLHGTRDGVADINAAFTVASHMGADFVPLHNTFHNPYTNARIEAVLSHFASNIKKPQPAPRPTIVEKVRGYAASHRPPFALPVFRAKP